MGRTEWKKETLRLREEKMEQTNGISVGLVTRKEKVQYENWTRSGIGRKEYLYFGLNLHKLSVCETHCFCAAQYGIAFQI